MLYDQADKVNIIECLIELARILLAEGDVNRAAELLGNVDALRETTGYSLPSNQREHYEHILAAIVAALGEAAFDEEHEVGKSMPLERAIARVLQF